MLFLEKLTLFQTAQLHKLCCTKFESKKQHLYCTITVPLYKAYIETFTIDISLLHTLYTPVF
jgi:hypothetical protein